MPHTHSGSSFPPFLLPQLSYRCIVHEYFWTQHVLKAVPFTQTKHTIIYSSTRWWWLKPVGVLVSACHHECCCYVALETKSTLTCAPISTGQILPYGIDCQIKGCYYFEQILPEGVPKRLKYFTALLTLCEGWSLHILSCSTEYTSKLYQFDGENENLAIVLFTSFTAIIFCVASSIPLSSPVVSTSSLWALGAFWP